MLNNQNQKGIEKLEKFEQEFFQEINALKSVNFAYTRRPEFKFPAYEFIFKKAYAVAFGMPAFAFMFAFFFYTGGSVNDSNIAMLEDSNSRILNEINSLDNSNDN